MAHDYLKHDDPEAYEGLEKIPINERYKLTYECPCCKGYGGWILRKNAYGEGKHFKAHCSVCNGWGYTRTFETCVHEWDRGVNVGRCLNTYTCVKCGKKQTVDSSD